MKVKVYCGPVVYITSKEPLALPWRQETCTCRFLVARWFTILIGSLLISGCIISEAYYLVTSLWRHNYYYMYIYLTLAFVIMGYVASTVSVVQTYLTLSAGNYHWWWRSFFTGFAAGAHIFIICSY